MSLEGLGEKAGKGLSSFEVRGPLTRRGQLDGPVESPVCMEAVSGANDRCWSVGELIEDRERSLLVGRVSQLLFRRAAFGST